MALLQAAVNVDPTATQGGPDIMVESSALVSENSLSGGNEADNKPTSDQISVYEVRKGDTLASIAKMYNVSVNTIKWANDIKKGGVSEGDIITILPISGIKYTVKKGDTLASIAKKYKADLDEISRFNLLDNDSPLAAGSEIVIPDAEPDIDAPSTAPQTSAKKKSSIASAVGKVVGNLLKVGFLQRPVKGGVKTQGIHGHNAVDIGIPVGSELFAAASGKVLIAKADGWNGGYGGYIVLQHPNGVQTVYGHLSQVDVTPGQQVTQGQHMGATGNTGKSTGPHLHFEVRGAVNPF